MAAIKVLAFLLFLLLSHISTFFVFFISCRGRIANPSNPCISIRKRNLKYSISIRGLQMQLTCQLEGGLKHTGAESFLTFHSEGHLSKSPRSSDSAVSCHVDVVDGERPYTGAMWISSSFWWR